MVGSVMEAAGSAVVTAEEAIEAAEEATEAATGRSLDPSSSHSQQRGRPRCPPTRNE